MTYQRVFGMAAADVQLSVLRSDAGRSVICEQSPGRPTSMQRTSHGQNGGSPLILALDRLQRVGESKAPRAAEGHGLLDRGDRAAE